MDFYKIKERSLKKGYVEIYPDFIVGRTSDLMVRGKTFYAVWDEAKGMWSTDEYDVARLVDEELYSYFEKCKSRNTDDRYALKTMCDFSSGCWKEFKKYVSQVSDKAHTLDSKVMFTNSVIAKKDHVSKTLPYAMNQGSFDSYEELISTLYDADERKKIEWAIGAVISGDAKNIQKFIVFYGEGGTGKSTIMNIIQKLFEGYYVTFDAKELVVANNAFTSGALFNNNPLVAIQHDGDLSGIKDNSKLNSIVAHEEIMVNEKFKSPYPARANCFLFMGTNKPVKITDAKSGIIRRLIDVHPTGNKIPATRYNELMAQIDFELGAIAHHCLEVYKSMGKNYYNSYKPMDMLYKTDPFFNFVQEQYATFKSSDGVTLKAAYSLYKEYCNDSGTEYVLEKYKFREELKNYFKKFEEETRDANGKHVYSYYSGFLHKKFEKEQEPVKDNKEPAPISLVLDKTESLLDEVLADCPAQYANIYETPSDPWADVTSKLKDINTSQLHYVKVPENHIVIDFDLKDDSGEKSYEKNIEAASLFPATYTETSKSGNGIHLHYIYDGDVNKLSRVYSEGIEIKVFTGNSSLRRKVVKCNKLQVAHLSEGQLPLRGDKKVVIFENIKNEKALRTIIIKNLRKEYYPNTKPSIDFIYDVLEKAYENGMHYDVSDLENDVTTFAMRSSNQSDYCLKRVSKMKFKSDEPSDNTDVQAKDDKLVFFDIEVFPNVLIVCWKLEGDHKTVRMINPSPTDIEDILKFKLIGFNCRKYDNHILYAAMMDYTNYQLFQLSQKIIDKKTGFFGEAYNLSYTDVYDFASAANKMSLKKWEIKLGLHHQENQYKWDEPLPEDKWEEVTDYCCNDVEATEAVFHHLKGDWIARQILADLADMTVNDTTNSLSTRLVFGTNRKPQSQFNYRNLALPVRPEDIVAKNMPDGYEFHVFDENGKPTYQIYDGTMNLPAGWSIMPFFPGYKFEFGKSSYKDVEDIGEGGYVYSEPGMYGRTKTLDAVSEHPSSIEQEGLFGPVYTPRFSDIKRTRVLIKHKEYDLVKNMYDGKIVKYIEQIERGEITNKQLANAFKTVINAAYGLTDANFEHPFRDPRNIDNIVAKRGSLFMINLRNEVQAKGYQVIHCKTDSIKIVNPDAEIEEFCCKYAHEFGYEFEVEHVFEKICLVNKAVYVGKLAEDDPEEPGKWTATGTQFAVPYVFKTLFSHEEIVFEDMCETKSAGTALYLDMNETLPSSALLEAELAKRKKEFDSGKITETMYTEACNALNEQIAECHKYIFVGKVGAFCPIKSGHNGGELMRIEKDGRYSAATGTTGYRWLEAPMVKALGKEHAIDKTYYISLVDAAIDTIKQFGDVEKFLSEDKNENVA